MRPPANRSARRGPQSVSRCSDANKHSGLAWDAATLKVHLRNPQAKAPGARMSFPGLTSGDEIANAIAHLEQFGPDGKKR
jgi:cytochrome c2